ncbi:MAG: PAS domain S-box protein [Methanoregula sp.]|nr:MAG: PAS domain S-box protein [Methanoregula sp.]
MMDRVLNRQVFWISVIGLTVIGAVYSTIYSLTHGILDVFPFLYFMPIILVVYFYPKRAVVFSLLLSTTYIFIVYFYGFSDPKLVAVSTAWFVIFITISVVTSSFAIGLRAQERKFQRIFENSQAGIFTFDCRTLIMREVNEKCARLLRYECEDLIGRHLSVILPESMERDRFILNLRERSVTGEIELQFAARDGTVRQLLLTASIVPNFIAICSAIDITERKLAEKVIQKAREELEIRVSERTNELTMANEILRAEISERKRFEEAIQLANKKLNTLSSITRHDILNQITALGMYLSLAKEIESDPAVNEYLVKIEQITQLIQRQIRFTRDYQNIGTTTPLWQKVQLIIDNTVTDLQFGKVALETDLNNLEIYADLLLEKVFYNLMDNALRHGEKLTKIRFYFRKDDAGITIVCEDDGVGIPEHAKEKIFRREFYRNTGYGLFLVLEILGITGLSIKETGEPGKGARFEIVVPPGSYRFGK